ncbi:hypothetical protein KIL84_005322 [Mauremys mutica]|uniref:Uncharacterized protein n=1 Tax=Mauremys mutica TaxID=74926 RepID=A0A9D3XL99_9SAUR|nr:hypothetical protein KIL84_005322 [Mauremys mutica]
MLLWRLKDRKIYGERLRVLTCRCGIYVSHSRHLYSPGIVIFLTVTYLWNLIYFAVMVPAFPLKHRTVRLSQCVWSVEEMQSYFCYLFYVNETHFRFCSIIVRYFDHRIYQARGMSINTLPFQLKNLEFRVGLNQNLGS